MICIWRMYSGSRRSVISDTTKTPQRIKFLRTYNVCWYVGMENKGYRYWEKAFGCNGRKNSIGMVPWDKFAGLIGMINCAILLNMYRKRSKRKIKWKKKTEEDVPDGKTMMKETLEWLNKHNPMYSKVKIDQTLHNYNYMYIIWMGLMYWRSFIGLVLPMLPNRLSQK